MTEPIIAFERRDGRVVGATRQQWDSFREELLDGQRHHFDEGRYEKLVADNAGDGSIFTNIRDYLRDIPENVPWLCEPVAYFGGVSLIAGIWKGGKSTFVFNLVRARERGEEFMGNVIPKGPTVYVTEEGGIPIRRKAGMLEHLDILDRRQAAEQQLSFEALLASIKAYCEAQDGPTLVIIDTFAVWSDIEDENDGIEVTRAIRALSTLAQQIGAAIILVDHIRKEGGTHGRGIRGSGAKAATSDIYGLLDYATGSSSTRRSLAMEGRVIDPLTIALDYEPLKGMYHIVDDSQADQSLWDRYSAGISLGGDGLSMKELCELWGVTENTANKRSGDMRNAGRMRREQVGKAYRYWAVLPPVERPVRPVEGDGEDE